jgi:hypothetical protein
MVTSTQSQPGTSARSASALRQMHGQVLRCHFTEYGTHGWRNLLGVAGRCAVAD